MSSDDEIETGPEQGVRLGVTEWRRLLDEIKGPTYNQVADAIAARFGVSDGVAFKTITRAFEDGVIAETDGPGAFLHLVVITPDAESETDVDTFDPSGAGVPSEPQTDHYRNLRFTETVGDSYGELPEWDSWMPTCSGKSGKLPYAKYHDHPALDYYRPDDDDARTDKHPQYVWSDPSNWSDFATVDEQVECVPGLIGRAFIMQSTADPYTYSNDPPADPFLFADGDKVIDPETGEAIPEFVAAIELLAGGKPTWIEVSGSEAGAHAMLRGTLPDGNPTGYVQLRDEPLDGYDEPPMLELYRGPHVVAATGNRVAAAPETFATADPDGVARLDRAGTRAHPNVLAAAAERWGDDGVGASESERTAPDLGTGARPDDVEPGLCLDLDAGPDDAPDDLPKCYERLLLARYEPVNLPTLNNHGVNLYAALTAIRCGFDPETATDHFGIFAPNGDSAKHEAGYTRDELKRTERKVANGMHAPAVSALRRAGIFDRGESCDEDCPIHGDEDEDLVAILPELPKAHGWGPITAERDDGDGRLSIEQVRRKAQEPIVSAIELRSQTVACGLMGTGKTYGSFDVAHWKDVPIFYASGRKELYEQGRDYAIEVGVDPDEIKVLPSPDDCPAFTGECGDAERQRVVRPFGRGANLSTIHRQLDLACEGGDRACPYQEQNKFDPDDYQVIIGHYKHAHVPRVTAGRHVIIDEEPSDAFITRVDGDDLIRGINAFLALDDSPPIDGFDDLLSARHDCGRRREAIAWFNAANQGSGYDFEEADEINAIRFETEGFHAYAPHAVYMILRSEPIEDRECDEKRYPFEKASLPGIDNAGLFFTTSEARGSYFVEIQTPPDLEYATSIIALDGTPLLDPRKQRDAPAEWEVALGRPLPAERALTDDERARFLRETMGHRYIQTTEDIRPYSSAKYHDPERDAGLLAVASDQYLGGRPWDVLITSKKVADEYRERGFHGPDRGLANAIEHRGDVRGSDEYAHAESGVILGSAHHGDHELRRRAAWLGVRCQGEGRGVDRTYGDVGDAVLHQMRELDTAQCALRIGRGDSGRGATILLDTGAFPNWIPVVNDGEPADVSKWSKGERAVREAVADTMPIGRGDSFRTDDVTAALDELDHSMTPKNLRRVLHRHVDRGLLRKERDPDDGRRWLWIDTGLSIMNADRAVVVELPNLSTNSEGPGDTTNISRIESYTQNVRITPDPRSRSVSEASEASGVSGSVDPPPRAETVTVYVTGGRSG